MAIRWRLRALFLGLMAAGLGWIYLSNYARLGRSPLDYAPRVTATLWGGALALGLLLDALAGLYLRRFFALLAQPGLVSSRDAKAVASRAIRFPERASLVLLGSSVLLIGIHRTITYGGRLPEMLMVPVTRMNFFSSVARDFILALSLSLLLFTFSHRVLEPAVAACGLREVPDGRRFRMGLRIALVVFVLGVFNTTTIVSVPTGVPVGQILLYHLVPVAMTALVGYLLATDTGRDLDAIAGRLRVLAAGVRPGLFDRFAVTEHDEVGALVASINVLQDRVEREFRAIERDLEDARAIQMGMLPRSWNLPPGWDLAASLLPAQEVGGDFYDLIDLGGGRFGIAVGDAAGKGLPAALLMSSAVSLIRSHAPLHGRPGAVLEAVNRMLSASLPPMTFVTALYAMLDTERREITVSSAGHLPPWLGAREAEVVPSLPLGVDPEARYAERTYPLVPGEPVMLMSDGLVEAVGLNGALPDLANLTRALLEGGRPCRSLLRDLLGVFHAHLGPAAPPDDVTVLILSPPHEERLDLPSSHGAELMAAEAAARFARAHGLADRADDVSTAVGEACLNAITHGNGLRDGATVGIRLRAWQGWVEVCVSDEGPPFETDLEPPNLDEQMAGDGPIRGWGLHLMRSMADEIRVEPLPSGKQTCLRFGGESRAD